MKTYENDAEKFDVKEIAHLMRCFLIYIQIILTFIDTTSREWFNATFMFYVNRFLFFSIIYIWDSVKNWHLIVHAFRIASNVQNSSLWKTLNKIIENRILIQKKKQSQTLKSVEATSRRSQTCNRYNVEFECHFNYRYQHSCFICEIDNYFSSQCSSDREQMWSREDSS
jgi:hypothetical protein